MNDKFNDDDFSWLNNDPDDPEKKGDSSQKDDSFAWQQSDDEHPAEQSGKHLGVTGQLSWLKDSGDTGDDQDTKDDEGLAWQADEDDPQRPSAPNRTGLTGTLSWQRENQPEKSSDDWMSDFASALDKMSDADDEESQPAAPKSSQPTAAPSADVPDWLSSADDDFDAPQAEDTFEPVSDSPDWLTGADDADDLYSAPQTPAPSTSDTPDWLTGFDDEEPAAPQPAAMDSGRPSLDDLFGDDEPIEAAAVPDWLSDVDEEPAAPQPVPAPESARPSLDDLFGDAPDEQQWEDAPWEAEPAPAEEDIAMDDLFPLMDEEDEPEPENQAAPLDTGFLSSLGMSKPAAPPQQTTSSASVDDFLAGLGFDDEDGEPVMSSTPVASAPPPSGGDDDFDWFAGQPEETAPVESGDAPDWLSGLGDIDTLDALTDEAEEQPAYQEMADDDPFADFDEPAALPEPVRSQYQDIDDLMSSFGDDEMDLPKTDELKLQGGDIDFDTLLNQNSLGDVGKKVPQPPAPEFSQESSDLLADLGITVGQVSASSIMRQQQDRPLEELSDRLQALRERSLDAPASPTAAKTSTSLSNVLPGVSETLPPTPIQTGTPGIAGAVILAKEQQDRVALLRQLVGAGAQAPHEGDGDAPYTDWASEDLPAETVAKASTKPLVRPRRRFSLKIDRFLISLLLVVVVALPFVFDGAQIGSLPALQFAPDTPQYAVYDSINTLNPNDLVLVAVEYGPTAAGELDGLTDALLRHILARGAHPVIVSRNPVGLLHAGNILNAIGGTPNRDYYLARYLTADIVGLSSFAQNLNSTLTTDVNGNPTGLNLSSLNDFARIVVIVERADDLRAWAEQIAPLTQTPILAATNFAASPLSEPYLNTGVSGVQGLLIGAGDAYTYRAMLEGWTAQVPSTSTPNTETPTEESLTGEATETSETTESAPVAATETPRAVAVTPTQQTPEPSPTSQDSPTPRPTNTLAPTNTPRPTNTPEPTPTVEAIPVFAHVSIGDTVNVRAEPSRTAAAVGSARANERVEVIGTSDDGLWLNVRKSDGTEGWILAELLTIESSSSSSSKRAVSSLRLWNGSVDQDSTPEVTPESESTEAASAVPTIRPTLAPTVQPTTSPPTPVPPVNSATSQVTHDRRWYATTLGLMFVVIVIAFGNLVNLIRGLLRRSRTR